MHWQDAIRWNADGLVPAIAQDAATHRVLTLAWMNRESLTLTEQTREAHYWSRSRGRCGARGSSPGTSSASARSASIAIATRSCCWSSRSAESPATRAGSGASTGASRTGNGAPSSPCSRTRRPSMATSNPPAADVLARLAATIDARRGGDPRTSYVASLLAKGEDAVLKKIGEEATEAVLAAKDGDKIRITAEVADLWFHCLVLLARHGLGPADVLAELARREGVSGHVEKASRA